MPRLLLCTKVRKDDDRSRRPLWFDTSSASEDVIAWRLAQLSADEMVAALGLSSAPPVVRAPTRAALFAFSVPLGRTLARFDTRIEALGIARAAAAALADLEA